jgi:hypothetical protein
MTKERKATLATLLILAAALGVVIGRKIDWRPAVAKAELSPQDAVYAMLDAARRGNVQEYLASYSGQMEAALKQAIAEKTEAGFAKYLQEFNAPIKGIAITEPQPLSEREVKVRVEFVYQERNEAQTMYLEKVAGGWKIARLDSTDRVKTLIPYGTPVQ